MLPYRKSAYSSLESGDVNMLVLSETSFILSAVLFKSPAELNNILPPVFIESSLASALSSRETISIPKPLIFFIKLFKSSNFTCSKYLVPTIFSPNGTGPEANNKLWVFGKASCIQRFSFQIFDRWGEMVFESADISIGWDGNFKERPLPNGNFVYKLSILLYDNTIYNSSGSLTLVR